MSLYRRRDLKSFRTICLAMIAALLCVAAQAQSVDVVLDQSFHAMYNLQFEQALSKTEQAKQADKNDPMPWVAQASAILFREFDRLRILRSDMFASDDAFSARPAYSWIPASRKQFDAAQAGDEKLAQDRVSREKKDD